MSSYSHTSVGLGVLALLAIVSCGPEPRKSVDIGRVVSDVDTVNGVAIVRNSGTPPTWSLTEILRLGAQGSVRDAQAVEFGRVSAAVIGPGDRLYVADAYSLEIRVFDLDGSFLFSFGRDGEGPGEFGSLYSLARVGDTLLSLDYRLGRVGYFSADGAWLGQERHAGGMTGSGRNLQFYRPSPREAFVFNRISSEAGSQWVYLGYTAGGPSDTIPTFEVEERPNSAIVCNHSSGAISIFALPFAPRVLQHPIPGGMRALVVSDRYRIAMIDSGGDTTRVLERELEPVVTQETAWDSELAEYMEFRRETPGVPCSPRSPNRPEFMPPIRDFEVDPSGRLWVEVETSSGPVWEIHEPDGRLVGRIPSFPAGQSVALSFEGNRIVSVAPDSLGVETIRVFQYEETSNN